jgi:hypothetical protein
MEEGDPSSPRSSDGVLPFRPIDGKVGRELFFVIPEMKVTSKALRAFSLAKAMATGDTRAILRRESTRDIVKPLISVNVIMKQPIIFALDSDFPSWSGFALTLSWGYVSTALRDHG